ncbi:MAG: hypothetical protein ABFS28_03375 [Bacteroidota bacterium]
MKSAKPSLKLLAGFRKIIFLLILIWGSALSLTAQPYEHSLGIRAGYSSGISYKGFFRHKMAAIEASILYNRHGFSLNALYEYHLEPFRNKRLLIYLGGGAFGGNWAEDLSLGMAGLAGIEYTLRDLPLNFSLDWKPMLNLYRNFEHDLMDFGVSIRYRFKG